MVPQDDPDLPECVDHGTIQAGPRLAICDINRSNARCNKDESVPNYRDRLATIQRLSVDYDLVQIIFFFN